MRKTLLPELDRGRIRHGLYASTTRDGLEGAFRLHYRREELHVIASDGRNWTDDGLPLPAWEHVSVSCRDRCPTWEELEYIRKLFWTPDETVMQLHVPAADHVNHHPHTLHLWRPIGLEIPRPPSLCVGPAA